MKYRGIIVLACLFIISLVGISFYGGAVTYVFFFTVLLIPVMSLLYSLYVMYSFKIYQQTEGRDMISGEPSDFYITLHNEGWLSFSSLKLRLYSSFSSISGIDDDTEYELPPHTSIKKKTRIICRYRGEYEVGVKQVAVRDFLGLFSFDYRMKEPLSVIVKPDIVPLSESASHEMPYDADRDDHVMKTEPDIPVRDYIEGDDIRFINWKATAVMQKPMVRERKGEEKSGIAIVMDPGRYSDRIEEYLPPEDTTIRQCLSLALYYMENSVPVDFICLTDDVVRIPVMDMTGFEEMYGLVSGYVFDSSRDIDLFCEKLYEGACLSGYSTLIFVLQRFSDREAESIKRVNSDNVPVRVSLSSSESGETEEVIRDGRMEVI